MVKWFCEADPYLANPADYWARLRLDCFYASALRVVLENVGKVPFALDPVRGIDYATDFVREP